MADALVPVTDFQRTNATAFVSVTVPFLVVSTLVVGARLTPQLRPAWRFGWDDGFILIGYLLIVSEWAITMTALSWAVGSHSSFVSPLLYTRALKFGYIAIPIWANAVASIKLSIVCMLLRFQEGWYWKSFLYLMIVVQVFFAIGNTVFLLAFECHPIAVCWDPTIPGGKFLGPRPVRIASNTSSYSNIITDLILSLMPLFFIRKLKRSLQERLLICILLALGLTASVASIRKMLLIRKWGGTDDAVGLGFSIEIWTCLELFLGLFASCLPCLKAALTRWIGLTFSSVTSLGSLQVEKSKPRAGAPMEGFHKNPITVMKPCADLQKADTQRLISGNSVSTTNTMMSYPGRLDSDGDIVFKEKIDERPSIHVV